MTSRRKMSAQVDMQSGCPIRVRHLDDVIENDVSDLRKKEVEHELRYGYLDKEQFDVVDKMLKGGVPLDKIPCLKPKVVRMFVCSSGPDFESERSYVFEHVYPLVREYCRNKHGVEFQLADLDWGMVGQSSLSLEKKKINHQELKYCQEISCGPNFVAFIGQKYGETSVPDEILTSEMELIRASLKEEGQDTDAIDTWYTEDINTSPHVYRLTSPEPCEDTEEKMCTQSDAKSLLIKGAKNCLNKGTLDEVAVRKYTSSELENLLRDGLLGIPKEHRDRNCVVYMRDIENIDQHLSAKNSQCFVDLLPSQEWDLEKKEQINKLKQRISEEMCETNVFKSTVQLNGCTLDETKSGNYIKNIGGHFYSTVTKLVDKQMDSIESICDDPLCHEVARHWSIVLNYSRLFSGREDLLNTIKAYILSETEQPLVIQGRPGSGKTAALSKAASDINEAILNSHLSMPTSLITRFIGETGQSMDIQQFLYFLCHQMAYTMGRYRQEIPTDYKALKYYFIDLIQSGEYGGMVVILIDSVDQLTTMDNGHKLDWIPSRIAANVKIIVMVSSENKDMCQRLDNKVDGNVGQMTTFSSKECENIIKLHMGECNRAMNYNQWKLIQKGFDSCTIPLYVELVNIEACTWSSFESLSTVKLPVTCKNGVEVILEALEKKHGKMFVSHTLGYLSSSRQGFSESELEDILSLDDDVLNSVFISMSHYPRTRRIPPAFWARLRQDLLPYLQQKEIDGIAVLAWKHSTFYNIASQRYIAADTDKSIKLHSNIADYFLGSWSGTKKKPFLHPSVLMAKYKISETEDSACRHVPNQPMSTGHEGRFNLRKMSQLTKSLVYSQRYDDLKAAVLCNYDWLDGKLRAYSVQQLLADFSLYEDRESSLVADALRMSKSALNINPKALGMELTGRLLPHAEKYGFIKGLVSQCDEHAQKSCPLVANCQIYSAPGGPLQYECDVGKEVHCPIDIDVYTSPDGILLTAKPYYSQRLQIWDLATGDERPDMMLPVGDVRPTRDGKYINIFQNNASIKTYKSDCGVLHGEVSFNQGTVADVEMGSKYVAFSIKKGAGPYVVDIERSEVLHKFGFHTHAVAISDDEMYLAFNSERSILLYELPLMNRRCVATATDIAHDIIFMSNSPKCYVLTKTKLTEAISFDVINRKFTCKTVVTDLETKELIPSNTKSKLLVRCGRTLHLIDTEADKVLMRFQKLPPDVFVDHTSTFSGAGFTPNDEMIVASRYTYLIVWSAQTGLPVRVLQSTVSPMVKLFTSDSVNKAVSLLENNTFQVWNLDNLDRDILHSVEIHPNPVKSVAVSCSSRYIVSHDAEIPDAKIISLDNGKVVDTLQHSEDTEDKIVEVKFAPDGLYVVTRAKIAHTPDSSANTTFVALTDDVMWEVETASKVFHAITNRFILFSPNSEIAAFVTCAFYNKYDWDENAYNVFIVNPETSSNRTIDFPYNTEFVAEPCITRKGEENFFVAVIQTCQKAMDLDTRKEKSRWSEVRLFVHQLSQTQRPHENSVLRLQNIVNNANDTDQFLDAKRLSDGNLLVVYAKNVESYSFEIDRGLVHPRNVAKGAFIFDVATTTSLKHMPSFMDPSSHLERLLLSSHFTVAVDNAYRIYSCETNMLQRQLKQGLLAPNKARLCLDGRYLVGISENRRKVLVIRTSDGVELGSVFVHGRATCIEVGEDDRTVVVGCNDGRLMIMSMILEFPDPVVEHISKLPSRNEKLDEENLISRDIKFIANSTPDQHRLSARMRKVSSAKSRRPPSYSTLQRAVTISRQSSRCRSSACIQQ